MAWSSAAYFMNKIIESDVEELLVLPEVEEQWQEQDSEVEDFDMATAISDAHDDPC
jgi:hypothetical protein